MAVSKKLRFEVFRRDNFQCRYCGRSAMAGAVLEVDHVEPRARGGSDSAANLVTACEQCNSGKSDTPLDAPTVGDVPQVAFRMACAARNAPDPQGSEEYEDFNAEAAVAWGHSWGPNFVDYGLFSVGFALAVASGYSRQEILQASEEAGYRHDPELCAYLPQRVEDEEPAETQAYADALVSLGRFIPAERREFIWRARVAAGGYVPSPRQLVRAAGGIADRSVEEEGRDWEALASWIRRLPDGAGSKLLARATAEWDATWQGYPGHAAYQCPDEVLSIAVSYALSAEVPA
jgi:hypothetical protein